MSYLLCASSHLKYDNNIPCHQNSPMYQVYQPNYDPVDQAWPLNPISYQQLDPSRYVSGSIQLVSSINLSDSSGQLDQVIGLQNHIGWIGRAGQLINSGGREYEWAQRFEMVGLEGQVRSVRPNWLIRPTDWLEHTSNNKEFTDKNCGMEEVERSIRLFSLLY